MICKECKQFRHATAGDVCIWCATSNGTISAGGSWGGAGLFDVYNGTRSRYKILNALADGKCTVRDIAKQVCLSRSGVYAHIKKLDKAGVLSRSANNKTGLALRRAARYDGVWYAGEPVEREN